MIGKLPPELLEELVVERSGASDERVRQGPAYGEDTAAIRLDDGVLVVNYPTLLARAHAEAGSPALLGGGAFASN